MVAATASSCRDANAGSVPLSLGWASSTDPAVVLTVTGANPLHELSQVRSPPGVPVAAQELGHLGLERALPHQAGW